MGCLVGVPRGWVDAGSRRLVAPGSAGTRLGPFEVRGIRVGDAAWTVRVRADGAVDVAQD